MTSEWKVLRNGRLWTDRFDSEDLAYAHIDECKRDGTEGDYEVKEMTKDDLDRYK